MILSYKFNIVHNFNDLTKNSKDYLSISLDIFNEALRAITRARHAFIKHCNCCSSSSFGGSSCCGSCGYCSGYYCRYDSKAESGCRSCGCSNCSCGSCSRGSGNDSVGCGSCGCGSCGGGENKKRCLYEDGYLVADVAWIQDLYPRKFQQNETDHQKKYKNLPERRANQTTTTTSDNNSSSSLKIINPDRCSTKSDVTQVNNVIHSLMVHLRDLHTIVRWHQIRVHLKYSHFSDPDNTCKTKKLPKGDVANDAAAATTTRNKLLLALECSIKATLMSFVDADMSCQRLNLLQKSSTLLQQHTSEETKLYSFSSFSHILNTPQQISGTVPDPPILVHRTDDVMCFRPGMFCPAGGVQVAYYKLFGCLVTSIKKSAGIIDDKIEGCGIPVSALFPLLRVTGLVAGEKYSFAIGAYNNAGELIGGKISKPTNHIVASYPLSTLIGWTLLCKASYDLQCYPTLMQSGQHLWRHFVLRHPSDAGSSVDINKEEQYHLSKSRLNKSLLAESSPELKKMLLYCMLAAFHGSKIQKLELCEQTLAMMELSKSVHSSHNVNIDKSKCRLQSVVECYNVLKYFLFYGLFTRPVVCLMKSCMSSLTKIPSTTRCHWGAHTAQIFGHMISCLSFYLAKIHRSINDLDAASHFIKLPEELLSRDYTPPDDDDDDVNDADDNDDDDVKYNYKKLKINCSVNNENNSSVKTVKSTKLNKVLAEDVEKPSVILATISKLSSKETYQEITKLKPKHPQKFLEFLITTVGMKALKERENELLAQWMNEANSLFVK
ncbi:hypothetical protein HELRODRAFT_171988 [Helobdella robusta]|uniref:Uncharacterized protein n=1 Tax=Helobdella robusta TaxID=6412 RepID=T1F4X3_HELRO|nr:hypothetical protein HELRODRAFT_171988 [Helobdella robusta]ESO04981.1 hypothetical protein HELRODRAFT_171988 [Helobdella robusta]